MALPVARQCPAVAEPRDYHHMRGPPNATLRNCVELRSARSTTGGTLEATGACRAELHLTPCSTNKF